MWEEYGSGSYEMRMWTRCMGGYRTGDVVLYTLMSLAVLMFCRVAAAGGRVVSSLRASTVPRRLDHCHVDTALPRQPLHPPAQWRPHWVWLQRSSHTVTQRSVIRRWRWPVTGALSSSHGSDRGETAQGSSCDPTVWTRLTRRLIASHPTSSFNFHRSTHFPSLPLTSHRPHPLSLPHLASASSSSLTRVLSIAASSALFSPLSSARRVTSALPSLNSLSSSFQPLCLLHSLLLLILSFASLLSSLLRCILPSTLPPCLSIFRHGPQLHHDLRSP